MYRRFVPALALLMLCGCAARGRWTYRLVQRGATPILIPPGVASADAPVRQLKIDGVSGLRRNCGFALSSAPVAMRPGAKATRVTIDRDALLRQPSEWLTRWTVDAEAAGCLAPGAGTKLASRIVESIPVEPGAAYRLLHPTTVRTGYFDLGPEHRLQVNSPIMLDGAAFPEVQTLAVSQGAGASLNVDVKAPPGLVGYEVAWYAVRAKPHAPGYEIQPISAERHIDGGTETSSTPLQNVLEFGPEASFYRLFYKAEGDVMRIIVAAGETRAALDRADPNRCARPMCLLIPRSVALNPSVVVTVNGRETPVPAGSTVSAAILAAGERNPAGVIDRLKLRRLYDGKLVPVEFDPARREALQMPLLGGESLAW